MPSKSNTVLIWALLVVVIGWRVQDFFDLGMATGDQLDYSTDLLGHGVWETALQYARSTGRIYFLLTKPVDLLAATFSTSLLVQISTIGLFAVIPFVVAWIVFRDRGEQVVFLLAYWTLCAAGWHMTTPAAYPIVPMIPFVFVGAAAVAAQSYSRSPSRHGLLAYATLAFAACFQYESAALIGVLLLAWFIRGRVPVLAQRRHLYAATALAVGLYAAAYLAWHAANPSNYGDLGNLSPVAIGRVMVAYAIGALPLPHRLGTMPSVALGDAMTGVRTVPYPELAMEPLLYGIEWMDVIVSVAAGALFWFVLSEGRSHPGKRRFDAVVLRRELLLGFLILAGSNILLAISSKYQAWAAAGSPAYLTSYFALFGWAVLAASASRLIERRFPSAVVTFALSAVFLYSSTYNHATAKQIRANASRWQAVAALAACRDQLSSYQSFAVPAAFQSVYKRASNWSAYWREWTLSSFGFPLQIVPDAASGVSGATAVVRPVLNDRGKLKALVGQGPSRGFVIFRGEQPNYVWMHGGAEASAGRTGTLVAMADLARSLCRDGYRMIEFDQSGPDTSLEVSWHLPDVVVASDDYASLFIVPDAEVDRAVQALYLAYFRRPADPAGLQYWAAKVRRWGGTVRDVAEGFSTSPEHDREHSDSGFSDRVAQIYARLAGRAPRPDELERLDRFRGRPELSAFMPWLVAADLLKMQDAAFLNRLRLAQHYTESPSSGFGSRIDLWEKALRVVNEQPESVQLAISILHG
jgi:hypothetical protein